MAYYKNKKQRRQEYRKNAEYRQYVENLRRFIVTTRFNTETWNENIEYRKENPMFGCAYGSPQEVCVSSPLGGPINGSLSQESILFVLEMNNDNNTIMGIGMIKNQSYIKKFRIYGNDSYNRYGYVGKYRIDRNDISSEDEIIFQVLEKLCFYGAGHLKKMPGIKGFPIDKIYKLKKLKNLDLVEYITNMFKIKIKRIKTNDI